MVIHSGHQIPFMCAASCTPIAMDSEDVIIASRDEFESIFMAVLKLSSLDMLVYDMISEFIMTLLSKYACR